MAVDAEFEDLGRAHITQSTRAGVRHRRGGVDLRPLNVEIDAKNKADLIAMAIAEGITQGRCIDILIEREVARRVKKSERDAVSDYE